ncbi:hypothetical protein FACS189472_05220 [Alphaproteobacteria bacterium]|nr:hypothetical protein FACS189472_05220 [Alphaproteobacteria bacterium]
MENVAENDPNSIVARHKAYVRLIELLEQSAKNGMSKEQMDKILDVYESELFYGVCFTGPKQFMACVKAYQDLSQLVKSWPKENAEYKNVVEDFEWMQEKLLGTLKMLKTIAFSDNNGKYVVSDFLEYTYANYFTYLFIRCPDFFNKRIAESIRKGAFSPAIAFALYAKLFDSKSRHYEVPDVAVLSGNNFSGHILLVVPPGCCNNLYVDTFYANKNGIIEKVCIRESDSSYMVSENCFSTDYGADYKFFYTWNPNNETITFRKIDQSQTKTEGLDCEKDFKFIPEKKQWILHESRKVPYPYKGK